MTNNFKTPFSELRTIRREQFDVLYQVSRMLNQADYTENLVEKALDLVVKVINAERALFVKYDPDSTSFCIVSARNVLQESIDDLSAFSSGILQQVIEKEEPCLYHDVLSDPSVSQFESVQIHQIKSVIGVPVFYDKRIWGVILADSRANRQEFNDDNLLFLEFFGNMISLALDKANHFEALQRQNAILLNQLQAAQSIPDMVGQSAVMKELATLIHKVAQTDATVLILGESGTGKDLAARAIHQLSTRSSKPFLGQFCGSIPDSLLESELFGYKKGAFTGAGNDKKGLFEVADGGTFFLDEIADISLALQAKLLRVIQNREIIRLGDTQVKKVDVRLIAATNTDLKDLSVRGKFRQDLFYRLNVFPITMPPLRERFGDIPILTHFLIDKMHSSKIKLDQQALKKLESFSWPGNIRQLENTIQRALILCDGDKIGPEHIILEEDERNEVDFSGTLKEFEKLLLKKRLKKYNGNRTLTARSMGVSVRWIQLKLKDMNG